MTVASIARRPVTAGAILWLAGLVALPAPLIARLALAGPLVLVPRIAPALAAATRAGIAAPAAAWPWIPVVAGGLAALSFTVPTGSAAAAALATPWLLVALGGAATAWSRLRPRSVDAALAPRAAGIAADAFLVAGAAFLLFDRLALAPLGFDATIGLLSAAHFSVAGFGLVGLAGLLAAAGSRVAVAGLAGLIVGIPLTAAGWFIGTPVAAWPGSMLVAVSGLLVAAALARRHAHRPASRAIGVAAAVALATGMVLAMVWAAGLLFGGSPIAPEGMVRTHGVLNLGAVLVGALLLGGRARLPFHRRPLRQVTRAEIALLIAAAPAVILVLLDNGLEPRPGFELSRVFPAAALAGAAVPAGLLAGSRLDPRRRPVLSGITLGLLAIVVACAVTVTDQVLRSEDPDPLQGICLFVLGLLVVGWLACAVAIPCGLAWAWAFRRPRHRSA